MPNRIALVTLAWVIGTTSLVPELGQAGYLATLRHCSLFLALLNPQSELHAKNEVQSYPITLSLNSKDQAPIQFKKSVKTEVYSYFFGPMAIIQRLLTRRFAGETPKNAFNKTMEQDYPYLMGYFALFFGLKKLRRAFFEVSFKDFDRLTLAQMNPAPQKVLYLTSISAKDPLHGYDSAYFNENYSENPQNKFLHFENLQILMEKLKDLPQDSSFDRIEIMVHGAPNKLRLADGKFIATKAIEELAQANLKIAAKNADLRFISCSIAGGSPIRPADRGFLEEFGKALLSEGGRVFSSSKNIVVADFMSFENPWNNKSNIKNNLASLGIQTTMHLYGLGNFQQLYYLVLPNLWRNYSEALQTVHVIRIPPQS